jgi:hypothetical protein
MIMGHGSGGQIHEIDFLFQAWLFIKGFSMTARVNLYSLVNRGRFQMREPARACQEEGVLRFFEVYGGLFSH